MKAVICVVLKDSYHFAVISFQNQMFICSEEGSCCFRTGIEENRVKVVRKFCKNEEEKNGAR